MHPGECLALVGESGSGKSVTSRTLAGLTGARAQVQASTLAFAGQDLRQFDERTWRKIRGAQIGFVMQDALGSLDPLRLVGKEIAEPLQLHTDLDRAQRDAKVIELLRAVGVPEPELRARQYPYQLSGGLRQRALIASAIACNPRLLIADEPTTALDSHSGAEVMILLDELASQGHVVILITHDREVAARANRIIEIRDGLIISDSADDPSYVPAVANSDALQAVDLRQRLADGAEHNGAWKAELVDAVQAAWRVMWINKFRTALTLLGIIIGVASVVVMLAVGEGSKRQVMAQMGAFGSNIIYLSGSSPNPRTPLGIANQSRHDTNAMLDASIRIDGQVVGVLCLEQTGKSRVWQSDEIAFAGELADQFAQVINNHNRRTATSALHLFQRAVEQSANAFLLVNCEGVVEYVNPSFTAITQYSSDEVQGQKLSELPALENLSDLLFDAHSSLSKGNSWQGEFKSRRKNLEPYWGQMSISKVYGDNRELTHYIGIYEDITESKLAHQRIERLAYTDNLTSLGNRPAFIRTLDERFARASTAPICLLLVDIDNFKRINDSLGHQTGDKLLISLAPMILALLSRSSSTSAGLNQVRAPIP